MAPPRGPDLYITVSSKHKDGRGSGRLGAAWQNEDGTIDVQLDPGVVLDRRLCETHYLNLRPVKPKKD